MLFASCINAWESSTMKCVLLGLFGVSLPLHFCHNAPRFCFNQPVMQNGDMCFEVPRRKLLPAVLFLLQEKSQRVRVVGDSFKAFKLSVKRIGIACQNTVRRVYPVYRVHKSDAPYRRQAPCP